LKATTSLWSVTETYKPLIMLINDKGMGVLSCLLWGKHHRQQLHPKHVGLNTDPAPGSVIVCDAHTGKEIVSTVYAPAALGPYSQAVKVGTTLYISGQIGFDPKTMEFAGSTIEEQTTQVRAVIQDTIGFLYDGVCRFDALPVRNLWTLHGNTLLQQQGEQWQCISTAPPAVFMSALQHQLQACGELAEHSQ
jgi:hypothetical protein